jgi:hypothetical protein
LDRNAVELAGGLVISKPIRPNGDSVTAEKDPRKPPPWEIEPNSGSKTPVVGMATAPAASKNNSAAQNSSLALVVKFSPLVLGKAVLCPTGSLHSFMTRRSSVLPVLSTHL